ncbi:cyclic nucleotide-binding domain-containing protein [Sphingosinicella humi]|uniref:Oxidoreductase n=1 Tax=Allosphingosinicella humi TaxID=2068657 RepID=A0A2U2J597_9SPHN|nr:cyclic nucleotide-binding domain-containing protein [Sphingosinicella humi]PWG03461.1 oxidoreductase [Sphingosinicella humi]
MTAAFDIAIVGSGPAGLSAAARAAELGISHVLLEKTDHLSDTIYRYQKGKHVMATPSQLVLRSDMDFEAGKREKVLGTWDTQAAGRKINVKLNAEVKAIAGDRGDFTLTLTNGEAIKAGSVILAIGTQGNPNKMRCEGGDLPHIQYQLDDPGEYVDEHITVIGSGDAGIENALGLAADPEQGNVVTILNRGTDFARAKGANVKLLMEARDGGRINVMTETTPSKVEPGWLVLDTRDGEQRIRCDRIIARMGSAAPRAFVEGCGIEFTSEDREAFPKLSPSFESTEPGIYVIGALAGYPLIKHCMNQGYDVVEFINGNRELKPADEPILEAKFRGLPGRRPVDEWLEFLRANVTILNELSPLQMREFMLDSEVRYYPAGTVVFERNEPGSSLFTIADGSVLVEVNPKDPSITVPIGKGSIFGEVGLISGRRRGATIRTAEDSILVEVSRTAALKLMATVPAAKRAITRISTERQLLQMFGSGLTADDLAEVLETAEIKRVRAGEAIITEGEEGYDIYVIRQGSMVVEKSIGGKPVFLSYLPAGSYVGEMALIDGGRRTATVRAAIKSEVIKLDGDAFRRLLAKKPQLKIKAETDMASRKALTSFVESKKDGFEGVVDMYSSVANFLVENGIGEATDVLLIDENLCVGCDNCEKACADSHEGLSRLNREAGKTYAHLHVPTSCRHCEHPHCMADCPPNAIHRGPDGEVFIDDSCIGCGNCQRNCPYGVIRMDKVPPKKPNLLAWLIAGLGPGPGEPPKKWTEARVSPETPKKAIKCDMCAGISGGPACVRACPTGAAIRVAPEQFLSVARLGE